MDYGAQFYDPALGRFVSADSIVPEPGNPQALNRYAYVLNAPTKYVDPSGHCASNGDDWCTRYYFDWNESTTLTSNERREVESVYFASFSHPSQFVDAWVNVGSVSWMAKRDEYSVESYLQMLGIIVSETYYAQSMETLGFNIVSAAYGHDAAYLAWQVRSQNLVGPRLHLSLDHAGTGFVAMVFIIGHNGTIVPVPEGWIAEVARDGKGMVYQDPAYYGKGNRNMIRIADPNFRNPSGYVRYYNSYGQALTVNGKTGTEAETHIPLDYKGPLEWWPNDKKTP
jgi:hypothetical protein